MERIVDWVEALLSTFRIKRKTAKILLICVTISFTLSSAAAGTILWIMFQENSQGEMYDPVTNCVDWIYTAVCFAFYFSFANAVIFAFMAAGALLAKFVILIAKGSGNAH